MATTQTTDPDIAARRARVAAMRGTRSNRAIAEALGVGEATVRRDLAALDAERAAARVTTRQAPAPARVDAPRHDAPARRLLTLEVDDALADALRVLTDATPGARHTLAGYCAAARAAIRTVADTVQEHQRHDRAATASAARRPEVAP
ncbi:DeoR family transcriptional regulator [Streptomyces pseudogriseolus]|uniref:DeoR family transcriptional regulator n=1 Tax=Streptomyces pseudogriseolus TaxID=36817 RepID=UPI003FA2AE0E